MGGDPRLGIPWSRSDRSGGVDWSAPDVWIRGEQSDAIDFEHSVAFAPRQNLGMGLLYLLTADEGERESLISNLETTAATHGVDLSVLDPEEIYHGPAVDLAPDILFTMDELACAIDARRQSNAALLEPGPPSRARSANHRMDGIYLLAGNGVEEATPRTRLNLLDIAPTVLFVHEVAVPEDMDGAVHQDAFTADFTATRALRRTESGSPRPAPSEPGDLDAVQDHLEDLGYR